MIGKCLALALAAPVLLSADNPPVYANIPQVRQVMCTHTAGTAFRTGRQAFTTAWHVASQEGCTIDGEPIVVTHVDAAHDVAFLHTQVTGEPLKIDCGGFIDKAGYAGVGYASGLPIQRVIFVLASDDMTRMAQWGHFETMWGDQFIPGMSGGAVFNSAGEVVGVVNGFNTAAPLSYSQPLKDTALCSGHP